MALWALLSAVFSDAEEGEEEEGEEEESEEVEQLDRPMRAIALSA
jgi:hypothetical protein